MSRRRAPLLVLMCMFLAVLACNLQAQEREPTPTPTPVVPVVTIIAPAEGTTATVGQKVDVRSVSSDMGSGVSRVELRVNGQVVNSLVPTDGPQIAWTVQQSWTPQAAGEYTLEVVAYRGDIASTPATRTLTVIASAQQTTPGPVVPGGCTATTTANLNLRTGPATNYPVIVVLQRGASLPIIGRVGDNSWWQVRTTDGIVGWVSAAYTDESGDCSAVPLAAPPPPPNPAPTATSVSSVSPTATGPNLQVYAIDGPAQVILPQGGGISVTFVVTIRNVGGGAAGQFNVTFYPHGRADLSAPPQEVAVAPMSAGATVTLTFQHLYVTPGIYVVEVEADSARQVAESDEGDNLRTFTLQVFAPGYGQ